MNKTNDLGKSYVPLKVVYSLNNVLVDKEKFGLFMLFSIYNDHFKNLV